MTAPTTSPVCRRPRFVGRDAELRRVTDALQQLPALVLVEGEAGIGKSRLVREALAAVATGGPRTLVAVCPPFREALTLGPIVDAARQAAPSGADVADLGLSALAGTLRPLFPEWADGLPSAPEPLADAGAARHRLIRAFAELLDRLGIDVLVVEDVHWADEATLEFLLFLASRQPLPLTLMMTCRPEEVAADSLLPRLSSRVPTSAGISHARVDLTGLAVSDTAELVSSMLDDEHVSTEFATFLHDRTEGVPLALEECVRLLRDRADLVRRDGEWMRRTLDEISVPPTIRDAVTERVARLGADARRVLLAAAVLSDPADERTLGTVSGLTGVGSGQEAGLEGRMGRPADPAIAPAWGPPPPRWSNQPSATRYAVVCWSRRAPVRAVSRSVICSPPGRCTTGRRPPNGAPPIAAPLCCWRPPGPGPSAGSPVTSGRPARSRGGASTPSRQRISHSRPVTTSPPSPFCTN